MSKTYYLAGPMRGYPQYNFPAFHDAAAQLRSRGFTIISPAELDSPAIQAVAVKSADGMECDQTGKIGGETAGEILARDVRVLHDQCQGIVFLPGWEKSRGARLEAFVGLMCKLEFHLYLGIGETVRTDASDVLNSVVAHVDDSYDLLLSV